MKNRNIDHQKGGILFVALMSLFVLLSILVPGILSKMYTNNLYKRVAHAAHVFHKNPEAALKIMPQKGEWGVNDSSLIDDKDNHIVIARLAVRPFFVPYLNEMNLTYKMRYAQNPVKIVALVDVFFPEGELHQFPKLLPFLTMLKELGAMDNVDLTIVPFAGSINPQERLSFDQNQGKKKQILRKLADFEKLSPYKALLKNKTGELVIGDVPDENFWKGCVSCSSVTNSWEQEKAFGFQPYFWPSTFGKRYLDDKKEIKQYTHPRIGQIAVTGTNNWTLRNMRESKDDYISYGGFVLGPNIGCPPSVMGGNEFKSESLYPVTRGGSMLPLALDYAFHLLKDTKEQKLILLFKASPFLTYKWEGPKEALVTQESGFPMGDGGLDYNAYGSVTDIALLEKLKAQVTQFQAERDVSQKILTFSLQENAQPVFSYLGLDEMFVSLKEGSISSEELLKLIIKKVKEEKNL